ncbi:MAG: phospholipase D-like domain-containing protein [Elusimicrobiota bacterium]|jgi:SNF2 family DNA or RNA helicase|nr:phospholipase D-like domain-containing protein [Elusimicrobiota bacterium]
MEHSLIKDNHSYGTVGGFLKEAIKKESKVSIVSAYFTIYAYYGLKNNLDSIDNLKFLFGEPTFIKNIAPQNSNPRNYKIEDDKLVIPLDNRISQKRIAQECYDWLKQKAQIRSMVKPNFLHGKMYHIIQESGIEKAIAGSSNFTVNGLGLGGNKNIELNLIIDSDEDRKELKEWFDKIWDDNGLVADVKDEVLKYIEQLYVENTPQFIYFKTLYHIFQDYLKEHKDGDLFEKIDFYESQIWNALYDFQKDGVKGAINKILKHSGCIIADSVGLGKTYEALAVIKYFENLNKNVLVLCPKKLSNNWTIYQASQNSFLNPFKNDRFAYKVLHHTDMSRDKGNSNGINLETFNWSAFDLVIIDESHNFRGNPLESVRNGENKMNRAMWLMEKIVKSGVKTKVLMLSATPVNNSLKDLRNQIAFITEGRTDALLETSGIKDIDLTLKIAQGKFSAWASPKNKNRTAKILLEALDSSFFKLLDELTIARSRKHIKAFYDIKAIGNFPKRETVISVYPNIDMDNRFPSYDRVNKQILEYNLAIFKPSEYIKKDKQDKYKPKDSSAPPNFNQKQREHFLIGMIKTNFLKRLESSIESFEISLENTIRKIEDVEKQIIDFKKFKNRKENLRPDNDEIEEDSEDSVVWEVGEKLTLDLEDLDLDKWSKDLKKDKEPLIDLLNNAKVVNPQRDAKLVKLKEIIKNKIQNPLNTSNKKVIVFTAFADTAKYLYSNLKDWVKDELKLNSALVCGNNTQTSFGNNDYNSILTNFSPKSKNRKDVNNGINEEIDILIATDCISEGQNLQDCDYLINYDIHWNPVRIIQRFGRIDRIGSQNDSIQLVNFWPTKDLDNYINLKTRVEARMALVDVTATAADNILNQEELITDDLKYRNAQLKKLQNEVLDIEEMDESISLTDFTLDDFRIELSKFLENNKEKLENSPLGLYAIVPASNEKETKDIIKSGIIFCFEHKTASDDNENVNPLNPYFLVYIYDDGTVKYSFTNAKQILEIYRILCQGKTHPYQELCDLFNKETENGSKMEEYSNLLDKSAQEILKQFKDKSDTKLTTDRNAVIAPKDKQLKTNNDFELITWLIVR